MARGASAGWRRGRALWLSALWPCWLAASHGGGDRPEGAAERDARDVRDTTEALEGLALPWETPAAPPEAAANDADRPLPCPPGTMRSRLLGLPVYGTLPNEGSTFGAIPILLRICSTDGRTHNIYAPSLSWNQALGFTGTMRWFGFLPGSQSVTATASYSQHVNRGALLLWEVQPPEVGRLNLEAQLQVQQSIFFRLFGIGPGSLVGDESNQARRRGLVSVRGGINLPHHLGVGVTVQGSYDQTLPEHIASLVPSRARFPAVAGVFGDSAGVALLADLRYDSRAERDVSSRGVLASLQGGSLLGVTGVPTHLRLRGEVRALWQHRPWFGGAARARVAYVDHPAVPFYYLSPLGGGMLLRGFIEDRFMDRGAWLLELEQRFRLLQTHLLGVTVDWRIDPFIAVGQVFHAVDDLVHRPRLAGGVGLRAWLHPNVVGRIDIAYAGEGLAPYVELGYPF